MSEQVAATIARAVVEFAVSRGGRRQLLLERAGIDPLDLRDDDHRFPFANYVALLRAGKELCCDPAFALHFGESFDGPDAGFACMTDALSKTMADAFGQSTRAIPAATGTGETVPTERFQFMREGADLWIVDTRENKECPEATEASFASSICMARRLFPGTRFLIAVRFTHAEPAYRAEYDRIFQMPIAFGSAHNAVLTDPSWLNQRPQEPSRFMYAIIKARAESLLERMGDTDSTTRRVETTLEHLLHTGDAGVDTVARRLGLSRQTLFRRLKAEGVTFKQLLDGLRQRLAVDYLSTKKTSVNETAYLVGFSDPAAFSRAFKRWTGQSPRSIANPGHPAMTGGHGVDGTRSGPDPA